MAISCTRYFLCCLTVVALQLGTGICGSSAIICKEEGRFPYPSDCGRYMECIPTDNEGQFLIIEGHCHGFPYSPSLRRCVSNEEEPECTPRSTRVRRGVSFPNEEFNYLCSDENSKLGCENCKLKYECISGNAYIEFCQVGSTCSNKTDFGGGACLPYKYASEAGTCNCDQIGVTEDSYSNEHFMFCDTTSDPPKITEFKCEDGKTFDTDEKECVEESPAPCTDVPAVPECGDKIETKVNPNNCAWSYTCIPNSDPISTCCQGNNYFDEDSNTCTDICDIKTDTGSTEPLCTKSGKVPDKTDCTKYHLCLGEGDENLHETVSCPDGTYFDDTACVSGPLPEDCTVNKFSYTTCPGFQEARDKC